MSVILIETQYFPSIAYFSHILKADEVQIEAHENFQKQTHRNRCYILTANKVDRLSIPTKHAGGKKVLITDVEIDYQQKWQNRHWRAISSAYAHAPYFEYYADIFKNLIYSEEKSLFELNKQILAACFQALTIKTPIQTTKNFQKEVESDSFLDLRNKISLKKPLLNETKEYYQVFGDNFVKNLSIIDLIFNEGPNSKSFL